MGLNPFEEYTAREKLELTSSTLYLSYFHTIWKGSALLACFDNVNSSIVSVNCYVMLEADEFVLLEDMILDYIDEMEENGIYIK
jgi:hypothetical protein